MNCEKAYNRIFKVLVSYKDFIDSQEKEYKVRKGYINKTYEEMKNSRKYTEEYLKEYREKTKPRTEDIQANIKAKRSEASKEVNRELRSIKRDMDRYFNAPLNPELATKIQSIAITGLKLSNAEFDLLQSTAKSYLDIRLLNQLAETRTKTEQKAVIKDNNNILMDNNLKMENVETPDIYGGIKVPNIDNAYKMLNQFERRVNALLNYYVGQECFSDMVECCERDKFGNLPEVYMLASADTIFKPKANDDFISTLNGLNIKDFKAELTEEDKALIDKLIPPQYKYTAKDNVQEIWKMGNEHVNDLIRLDDRYNKYIPEEN